MSTICEKCRRRESELVTVGVCRVCGNEITARRYQFEQHPDSVNTKMHGECSKKSICRIEFVIPVEGLFRSVMAKSLFMIA